MKKNIDSQNIEAVEFSLKMGEVAHDLDLKLNHAILGAQMFLLGCIDQAKEEKSICLLRVITFMSEAFLQMIEKENTNQQT